MFINSGEFSFFTFWLATASDFSHQTLQRQLSNYPLSVRLITNNTQLTIKGLRNQDLGRQQTENVKVENVGQGKLPHFRCIMYIHIAIKYVEFHSLLIQTQLTFICLWHSEVLLIISSWPCPWGRGKIGIQIDWYSFSLKRN